MSWDKKHSVHAPFFCKWCHEFKDDQYTEPGKQFVFCNSCNNYGINIYDHKKEWFRDGYFEDGGSDFTLEKKMDIIRHLLKGKGMFRTGSSRSDSDFERIVITATSLEIHKHDIQDIEKYAELELSWMRFWFNPEWEKLEPKWFGKACNGKFWELMFVKDLRKPVDSKRRAGKK